MKCTHVEKSISTFQSYNNSLNGLELDFYNQPELVVFILVSTTRLKFSSHYSMKKKNENIKT